MKIRILKFYRWKLSVNKSKGIPEYRQLYILTCISTCQRTNEQEDYHIFSKNNDHIAYIDNQTIETYQANCALDQRFLCQAIFPGVF